MESKELVVSPAELVRVGLETLPPVIVEAGEKAGRRFIEFFTRNDRVDFGNAHFIKLVEHGSKPM